MTTVTLAKGINPTCAIYDGSVFLAVQADPKGPNPWHLSVWRYALDLSSAWLIGTLDLGPETAATPRFLERLDGSLWLAFKEDASGTLVAADVSNQTSRRTLAGGAQGHLAARAHRLAWQVGHPGPVYRSDDLGTPAYVRDSDDSEGLWAIREDGWPLLRYECRELRMDLGTYPSKSGPVTLAENFRDGGGLLGEWAGVTGQLHVFPQGDTKDPHVWFAVDRCAVTAWGEGGVRLAVVTVADVKPPVVEPPVPEPLPPGTVIADTLPYVIGDPSRWPRVGPDNANMDCVPVAGRDAVAWVKFASPSFAEWWRWDGEFIYHHEDRSDGLNAPYHFSPRDQWLARRWPVGDVIVCTYQNTIWRTWDEGDNWSVQPFAYTMRLVAAFDAYPCGGDIGNAPVIVVEYDPTYTLTPRRGNLERFWFARGWGWWRWQSFKYGTSPDFSPPVAGRAAERDVLTILQARREWMLAGARAPEPPADLVDGVFHRLGGTRVTPIDPVRPWTPEPEPPEPPMPKPYDEQFYLNTAPAMGQGDPTGATNQAIADYAAMNRPVDGQYSIWFTRTEHDYQGGMTLPASWKKHRNEMRALLDPSGQTLPPFP